MSKTARIKNKLKKNVFVIISLALGLVLLIMCIIMLAKGCKPEASATPTPTAEQTATATLMPTATPVSTAEATPEPSSTAVSNTTAPAQTEEVPMEVSPQELVGIHIKVDTGATVIGDNNKFDDNFIITDTKGIDLEEIKLVIFISDYRGNSVVRYYDSMSAAVLFNTFKLDDSQSPVEVEEAKELTVFVNDACNAKINWAGQSASAAPRSEQSEPTEMTYKVNGKTITLSITNLDVLSKDAVFQPEE